MNLNKEMDEMKRKYEQTMEKHEEKTKYDLQQIDKLSVEKKLAHENEKQKVKSHTPCVFQRPSISLLADQ